MFRFQNVLQNHRIQDYGTGIKTDAQPNGAEWQ